MPALDPATVPEQTGSAYPPPLDAPCRGRAKRALGDAVGLTHFGVNLRRLGPDAWSAQRHWHTREDEFVYVLEGEVTLITDAGEQTLGPGMAAGFPAGVADGHHLVNRTDRPALYLEVGDRSLDDEVHYPDADLFVSRRRGVLHKSGEPY
ncbi:MAG: cupin domain-containing protein [Deltaproteobacteria bacterium]|nr:MAG: cupin domain-containing protein [Deltaproteobacteria bacterium]